MAHSTSLKIAGGLLVLAGLVAYLGLSHRGRPSVGGEIAYVLPDSLEVVDTPAEVRRVVDRLQAGDKVAVLARTAHWARVRLGDGRVGWVPKDDLLDQATHDKSERLASELEKSSPQADGHLASETNLHLEPGRDQPVLRKLPANQRVEIYGRRLLPRPLRPEEEAAPPKARTREAWYLVRVGKLGGWLLGRFVELDIPQGISAYAQGINMVAWQVLRTADDGGQQVPEYLVADRLGNPSVDFDHIRVFTWWVKRHQYVTAYVESNLEGYFPLKVRHLLDADYFAQPAPYFRLNLMDEEGHKYQKVYGLFQTIVRPLGTIDGWESEAMPPKPERAKRKAVRERTRRHRH